MEHLSPAAVKIAESALQAAEKSAKQGGDRRRCLSYRDLEEMMLERGLEVDHTTLYRWVQHYAPEMEKRLRWYWNFHGLQLAGG